MNDQNSNQTPNYNPNPKQTNSKPTHEQLLSLLQSLTGESEEVVNESLKNIYQGIALKEIETLLEDWHEYTIEEKGRYTHNAVGHYDLHKFLGIMNHLSNKKESN